MDNKNINKVINPDTKRYVKIGGSTFKKLSEVINPNTGRKIKINGKTYKKLYGKKQKKVVIKPKLEPEPKPEKPEIIFKLKQSAFQSYDKCYYTDFKHIILNRDDNNGKTLEGIPFDFFVEITKKPIHNTLVNELHTFKGIKYMVGINVYFYKYIVNNKTNQMEKIQTNPFLRTKISSVVNENEIIMDNIYNKLLENIGNYQREGSGWILEGINSCEVNISKYTPLRGSSYIDLPIKIKNKQCCLNVKNKDNECFKWAILSALHPVDGKSHPDRVNNYKIYENELKFNSIKLPVKVSDVPKFENLNSMNVNVFGYDEKFNIYPLHTSKNKHDKVIDLLLINQEGSNHYCWIKNLNGLLTNQYNKSNKTKYFCKRCLHGFTSEKLLSKHSDDCIAEPTRIVLPTEENKWMTFSNVKHQFKVPFIVYADFEALTPPISKACKNKNESYSEAYQSHEPCGYAYKLVCTENKYTKPLKLYRGKDCIEHFLSSLKQEEKYIKKILHQNQYYKIKTTADEENYKNAKTCHICEQDLGSDKVWDHCHITGKYRGAAHDKCNFKYIIPQYIPVVMHNFKGYDSHFIVQNLGKFKDKISIIPNNMEKYMSLTIGRFRFIDSLQFMNSSLDNLVKNTTNFYHLESEMKDNIDLLKRKGIYPYDYMNSWDRFNETKLPEKTLFFSKLNNEHISIEDYEHAQTVWNTFKISNLGEYHDLYLKTDVLLLADVFENFRNLCLDYYKLDAAHYFSAPALAWDSALKMTKVKLELFTNPDMHLFIEKGLRGGISVISGRYSKANNKYMDDNYDPNETSKYITYLDANNLYGWAMSQYLPTHNFKWIDTNNFNVNEISDDYKYGYIMEVDLEYPIELHDSHSDYPLAPERILIKNDMLSMYSTEIKNKLDIGDCKVEKLVPNLFNKTRYVVHYRNLKFYLEQGMKLNKIHRILQFEQSPWLKSYIDFNTDKRKQAKSDFEKDFFKLLNNSVFGKTMENVRKRINCEVVNKIERRNKLTSDPKFEYMNIINEDLVIIKSKQTKVELKKPIYCGFTILDLSKLLMFNFHYNTIKKQYGNKAKLLFTDTDSLCYEIETEDIYQDMCDKKELYDFSDYPINNKFHDASNKKIIGKFKDETSGTPIIEFVGLRSKMYSIKLFTGKDKKTAKGIKKNVIKNEISHNNYKEILENGTKEYSLMNTIRSKLHNLCSYALNKVGLCAFDDKRYILDNGKDTIAHGHYRSNNQ